MRKAEISRNTNETRISVSVDLDGSGRFEIATGVGFLDHMLEQLSRHSLIDMEVRADGDLHIDQHHTVEDTGIALGQALDEALGDRAGIFRFGHAIVSMDEARAMCAIDVSGRPLLLFDCGGLPYGETADFVYEMLE